MEKALVVGFASMLAFVAIIVKLGILVYFFILFNRLIKTVERIELQSTSIASALEKKLKTDSTGRTDI